LKLVNVRLFRQCTRVIAKHIPTKRELKQWTENYKHYRWELIAKHIPTKRELKRIRPSDLGSLHILLLQSTSRRKGNWNNSVIKLAALLCELQSTSRRKGNWNISFYHLSDIYISSLQSTSRRKGNWNTLRMP